MNYRRGRSIVGYALTTLHRSSSTDDGETLLLRLAQVGEKSLLSAGQVFLGLWSANTGRASGRETVDSQSGQALGALDWLG